METIDKGLLKLSITALNNCGLAAFKVNSKQVMETLISDFMSAVETVPVDKENDLPDAVADMYNILSDNKTMDEGFDIADAALAARNKKEEMDMKKGGTKVEAEKVGAKKVEAKKAKPIKETKPTKETKPVKPTKETKPAKPTKETKPAKPTKETKPAKQIVTKAAKTVKVEGGINVRPGTKIEMAVQFIRENPGKTMYDLKQCEWNDKNDEYRNKFADFIEKGYMRKEGKGYFINEGF